VSGLQATGAAVRLQPRTVLKWLGIALLGYAGAVALLYVIQRDLLYFPRRASAR
jgi:hypothetical protein